MMPNQYCHFSCQPAPSKLTTTNCGAFWPALSLRGTKPSGWTGPSPGPLPGDVVAAGFVVEELALVGFPVVGDALELPVAAPVLVEVGAELVPPVTTTLLVTVTTAD